MKRALESLNLLGSSLGVILFLAGIGYGNALVIGVAIGIIVANVYNLVLIGSIGGIE